MKNKTKQLVYWSIPVVILLILFSIPFNTKIYVGLEDGEKRHFENIAVSVKLNGELVYITDSLPPSFMGLNYSLIEKPLRMGFHSVDILTPTTGAKLKKTVFILFNHYIMVTYWEGRDNFTVHTGFNPFLFM